MSFSRFSAALAVFALGAAACGAGDPAVGDHVAIGVVSGDGSPTVTSTTLETTGPATTNAAVTPTIDPADADAGVVRVPPGGAPLSEEPGGAPFIQIHEGVVMGFGDRSGSSLQVTTTCNDTAWVEESAVEVTPRSTPGTPGPGFDLGSAVIVLDPGHGARDFGGVGPSGLHEKAVNLDIAERARDLMETPHDVDWETGAVTEGTDVAGFGNVWLTRERSGPNEGDYELGLGFRAELATAAGADAFISIHNNTVPRIDTDIPGTEVYYSIGAEGSDRLAALLYEEMLRSVSAFDAEWTGGDIIGARARVDPETGDDYYGILRRAVVPAVIVEGIYIDQPDQESLLATDEFRQAYAEGVYRGIVRFLTTDEDGIGLQEPELFPDDAGIVSGNVCELPAQP